jgi:hypothetical protein
MSPKHGKLMKSLMVVLSLMAIIAVSMLSVTLSSYVKQLQLFGDGWMGPKYFAFDVDSVGNAQNLAPGETVSYDFDVRNFDDNGVTQVPLHVAIEIDYPVQLADTGVIQADLYQSGSHLASDSGSGTLAATGATMPANSATTDTYTLTLTWLDSDLTYLGDNVSTVFDPSDISIRVSGYQ